MTAGPSGWLAALSLLGEKQQSVINSAGVKSSNSSICESTIVMLCLIYHFSNFVA